MIPKIIHYCWLSDDPFPESIQKCIDSWKRILPDYELVLWNFNRFPRGKSLWVDQAFDNRKYAFAADYIRLYALYNYGGIYLDSDVEVLKPFDDLLDLPYFVGQENSPYGIEAATIGCQKGWPLLKDLLKRYDSLSFVGADGSFDERPIPCIIRKYIDSYHDYHLIDSRSEFLDSDNVVNVFPVDFFSPKTWDTKEIKVTDRTYSIHHFSASWKDNTQPKVTIRDTFATFLMRIRKDIGAYKRRRLYNSNRCCIVSNVANVTNTFYHFFRVKPESPFVHSRFANDDFLNYIEQYRSLDSHNVRCVKVSESHAYKPEMDYCPIGRFGNSNIEMLFYLGLVADTELELWKENVHYMDEVPMVFVYVCDDITTAEIRRIESCGEKVIICCSKAIQYPYSLCLGDLKHQDMENYMYNTRDFMMGLYEQIKRIL